VAGGEEAAQVSPSHPPRHTRHTRRYIQSEDVKLHEIDQQFRTDAACCDYVRRRLAQQAVAICPAPYKSIIGFDNRRKLGELHSLARIEF